MGDMAESRARGDATTRITAPDVWDAGLHAESEAGPIDVGLSVEPSAVGVIVDAPGIGVLKLAFDVAPDGSARLAQASRKLSDGREAPLSAVDEARVQQLEGQLQRALREAEDERALLITERDEARDRAAVMKEEQEELRVERAQVERKLSEVTADLAMEREEKLIALGEREQAREAVEELRAELEPLRAAAAELESARATRAQLEGELETVRAALAETQADLQASRAGSVDPAELESAKAALAQAQAELEPLRGAAAELELLKPELDSTAAARAELEARLSVTEAELAQRGEALAMAVGRVDELQAQLVSLPAPGGDAMAVKEARGVALRLKAQADKLLTERDEARGVARQLHHKIEAVQQLVQQERDNKSRALAERDEWQARFRALAKGNVDVSQPIDFSREETRSYAMDRPTVPELPAVQADPKKKER